MALNKLLIAGGIFFATLPVIAGTLTVEFAVPEGAEGKVFAALFDAADKFPKKGSEKFGQIAPTKGTRLRLVFSDLPPGRYAVSAFLDRNGNEALDTNILGIPKEPYGFSRDARGTMGPPGFADAAFEHEGKDQQISIELK